MKFDIRTGKKLQVIYADDLIRLLDGGASDRTINKKYMNPYKAKYGLINYNILCSRTCTEPITL